MNYFDCKLLWRSSCPSFLKQTSLDLVFKDLSCQILSLDRMEILQPLWATHYSVWPPLWWSFSLLTIQIFHVPDWSVLSYPLTVHIRVESDSVQPPEGGADSTSHLSVYTTSSCLLITLVTSQGWFQYAKAFFVWGAHSTSDKGKK